MRIELFDLTAIYGPNRTQCSAYVATHSEQRSELERIAGEWTQACTSLMLHRISYVTGARSNGRHSKYCATCEIRV